MDKLDELRSQIDEIDKKMIALLEKRMQVAQAVGEYKKQHKTPVLQTARESVVFDNAVKNLNDKSYAPQAKEFMTAVMDISKDSQRKIVDNALEMEFERKPFDFDAPKGFFGLKGSNTEQAMINFFGNENGKAYQEFEGVFSAIEKDEIRYGILPIENSSTGAINDIYDLLDKYNLYIIGEQWLRIDNNLFAKKGSLNGEARQVFSHPQALLQCDKFVRENNMQPIACDSTAYACKLVSESDENCAAIASARTGKLYGLELLEKDINDCSDNFTRFIVIAKHLTTAVGNKISIEFGLENQVGTLFNALKYFAKYDINMIMIESRPVKNNPCNYYFYIDLEGNCQDKKMLTALEYIKAKSYKFKLLGEYRKGEIL
ncbi:MAG: chorismate mutase [Clostridia bacterium]